MLQFYLSLKPSKFQFMCFLSLNIVYNSSLNRFVCGEDEGIV